jgi:A/G-specific adenine glycosylase
VDPSTSNGVGAPRAATADHAAGADLASTVLDWYAVHGRDLAFRRTTNPWAILVSEVMAQQTQAPRAAEAWTGFMAAYPTPASLAAASPAAVIRAWRGLGYNRRALALQGAAIAIVEGHGGRVPDTLEALLGLPGVGPYTARAVLAIAFGRPVAALDVNTRRVVGRAVAGSEVALAPRALQALADELVPVAAAAAWTHALMDIGAAFCRPREPRCDACPLRDACEFRARGGRAAESQGAAPGQREGRQPRGRRDLPARASGGTPVRFASTSRWLRGRIVDRLRDAPDGAWVTFPGPMGEHGTAAVHAAIEGLARDGLVERGPGAAATCRFRATPAQWVSSTG